MMAESTQFQNLLGAIVANTNNILLIFNANSLHNFLLHVILMEAIFS